MSLFTVNLQTHVADLSTALTDEKTRGNTRVALSRLQHDGLAQVMSFVSVDYCRRSTLWAVSPQARLDAEVLSDSRYFVDGGHGAQFESGQLVYSLGIPPRRHEVRFQTLLSGRCYTMYEAAEWRFHYEMAQWWALRCRLPIAMRVENNRVDALEVLTDATLAHVETLAIHTRSSTFCRSGDSTVSGRGRSCLLCILPTFPNLAKLSINNPSHYDAGYHTDYIVSRVNEHIKLAASNSLGKLSLHQMYAIKDLSVLSGWHQLRHLELSSCSVDDINGLERIPALATLKLWNCVGALSLSVLAASESLSSVLVRRTKLTSVAGLGNCPLLRTLRICSSSTLSNLVGFSYETEESQLEVFEASDCALGSLDGLERCYALADVKVKGNRTLQTVAALSAATHLHTLDASACDLRSLAGLRKMLALITADVSQNSSLESLCGLEVATSLQKLEAQSCDLRDVDALRSCARLYELNISFNRSLDNLSGIAGLQQLTKLDVSHCAIRNVQPLLSCTRLEHLNLSANSDLDNTASLTNLPHLRKLLLRDCNLTGLKHLFVGCDALVHLDISENKQLRGLSGLAHLHSLQELRASNCDLRSLGGLRAALRLSKLDIAFNSKLTTLFELAEMPALSRLDASRCDVQNVDGLSRCTRLTEVTVMGNTHLTSLAGLAGAVALMEVDAGLCSLKSLDGLETCPRLAYVYVPQNPSLTSVASIADMPLLKEVCVGGWDSKVSDQGALKNGVCILEVMKNDMWDESAVGQRLHYVYDCTGMPTPERDDW